MDGPASVESALCADYPARGRAPHSRRVLCHLPPDDSRLYSFHERMTKQQVLDLYFLEARHKLIEIAGFLDRTDRAEGKEDFRLKAFRAALGKLNGHKRQRAKNVLLAFSDPTTEPVAKAKTKAACGAWRRR
jgi:hypothetical protein